MSAMLEKLRLYFPQIAKNMVDYQINGSNLIAYLDDGVIVEYDDIDNTLRKLPNNGVELTEDTFRNEFGRKLNKLMYRKGFTQQDLAERTGIHQVIISGYITGKHTPSFYNVCKLAKALECSTDEFKY